MLFRSLKIGDQFYRSVMDQLFGLPPYTKVAESDWNSEVLIGKKRCRIRVVDYAQVIKVEEKTSCN